MLVPPDELPDWPELEPLCPDELEVEPLCPDDPDGEDELGLWDDGELGLWDEGELLGELLGDGMLGEGRPELGELGGGELLLEEQPASAMAAARSRTGAPRLTAQPLVIRCFMYSASCSGPRGYGGQLLKSSWLKLNGDCTVHRLASSVVSTMVTWG